MYRSLASEVGCLRAEIFKEIRRCLRLRGGKTIDGIKWIYKSAQELAELFGVHEKTIRRHLKALVQMGWLKREQLDKRWGKRVYFYVLGEGSPLKPVQQDQTAPVKADKRSASKTSNPLPINSLPTRTAKTTNSQNEERFPADWPEPATRAQTKQAIENLRNRIGWLNRPPVVRAF